MTLKLVAQGYMANHALRRASLRGKDAEGQHPFPLQHRGGTGAAEEGTNTTPTSSKGGAKEESKKQHNFQQIFPKMICHHMLFCTECKLLTLQFVKIKYNVSQIKSYLLRL